MRGQEEGPSQERGWGVGGDGDEGSRGRGGSRGREALSSFPEARLSHQHKALRFNCQKCGREK